MLKNVSIFLESINETIGRGVAWLTGVMVILTFAIVIMRYGFNLGSIAIQESVVYLHSIAFMLAIAYTLKHDSHVRVDIFYAHFTTKRRAWIDLLGTLLFLIPLCIYIIASSWDYAIKSWLLLEGSREAGGLPLVFILKSLIPLMSFLLLLQGIATVLQKLQIIFPSQENN